MLTNRPKKERKKERKAHDRYGKHQPSLICVRESKRTTIRRRFLTHAAAAVAAESSRKWFLSLSALARGACGMHVCASEAHNIVRDACSGENGGRLGRGGGGVSKAMQITFSRFPTRRGSMRPAAREPCPCETGEAKWSARSRAPAFVHYAYAIRPVVSSKVTRTTIGLHRHQPQS